MTSLGGPRKAGTALGAPAPKKAVENPEANVSSNATNTTSNSEVNTTVNTNTSTTTTNGGTGLGGPAKVGTGLGGPAAKTGTGLGGPAKAGTGLGGPPVKKETESTTPASTTTTTNANGATGTGLGGPAKTGTGLGGPAKTGTGLGGPAKAGTGLGGPKKTETPPKTEEVNPTPDTKTDEVKKEESKTTTTDEKVSVESQSKTNDTSKSSNQPQKGPAAKKVEAAPQKGGKKDEPAPKKSGGPGAAARKALAEKIKKQQEEEERLRKEEEEKERLEEERRKKEEEEERIRQEKFELKRNRKKADDKERKKIQAAKKQEQQRQEALKRYGIKPETVESMKVAAADEATKSLEERYANKKLKKNQEKQREEREAAEKLKQEEEEKAAAEAKLKAEQEAGEAPDDWEALLEEDDKKAEEEKKKEEEQKLAEQNRIIEEEKAAKAAKEESEKQEQPVVKKEKNLRSPICCILGHVDTGKTSLLDKIRRTNVQGGEAGGITQQIGATYIPKDTLLEQTSAIAKGFKLKYKIPGLLVIDTPGHEIFTNLRNRGSSLCDIAVLVVDLMHSIQQQTRESIELLKKRKTPFIVAMNKIDRCYNWVPKKDAGFLDTFEQQSGATKSDFEERTKQVIADFAVSGLNAELYTRNPDMSQYVSLVPTSAATGEGLPDLLGLIVKLTETKIAKRITEMDDDTFTATVLEVKSVEGHGFTIDIILSNGEIRKGDRIVLCGKDKAIDTKIRALMTPQPLREMRVKTPYINMSSVKAAAGIKIAANGLENAVAGSELFIIPAKADQAYVDEIKEKVQQEYNEMISNLTFPGVSVQASTLGSLEAVLAYMQQENIPVAAINIGRIHKSDVIRAAVNLEPGKAKEYGCILAFDVDVEKNAQQEADRLGVKIWCRDIIYHLFDEWTKYQQDLLAAAISSNATKLVYPVEMEILPEWILAKRNPIILGVKIVTGWAKMGTQVCVIKKNEKGQPVVKNIGRIVSIEVDNEPLEEGAKVGREVAVKIMGESEVTFGRHFDEKDHIYSVLTRDSIDALVTNCRDLLRAEPEIVKLVKYLKDALGIDKFGTTLADEKKK